MYRSEITIDLAALRRNCATLLRALGGAELWAVVKANGYGHGASDSAGAAVNAGATAPYSHLTRHIANSAAALRYPSARFDAARCGIAVYGISPFGTDPAEDGLEPVLTWTSHIAQTRLL